MAASRRPSSPAASAAPAVTSRRKLADEGTSLSAILVDARMSFALTLLQSTAQPVTQIARCDRFGFPPTAVRRHRRTGRQAALGSAA